MECISITYDKSEHDLTALTSFCFDREKKEARMMTGYVGGDAEDIINIVSNQGFIEQYRRDIYNQALEDCRKMCGADTPHYTNCIGCPLAHFENDFDTTICKLEQLKK
mgnify:CR=1 FL=1